MTPPCVGPLTRFTALFQAAVVAHAAHTMAAPDVAGRTIRVDNLGIPPTPFGLPQSQQPAFYASGQAAARDFLTTWDFEPYEVRFHSGAPEVRRQPWLARPLAYQVAE
jgi:NTE family protein